MTRIKYDAAFRIRALNLAEEIGTERAQSVLGVSAQSLRTWKRLFLNGESMKKKKALDPDLKAALLEADAVRKELMQAKRENKELKEANLILKELAKFFSKDSQVKSSGGSLNSNKKKPV